MKHYRFAVLFLSGFSALTLAACGDGWVAVPYEDQVPYTEERTAGRGVTYVRAHMLPEKGPVLEASEPETIEIMDPHAVPALEGTEAPPEPEETAAEDVVETPPPQIKDAEPLFKKDQKGKK